jgi:hypothetical protein
VKISPLFVVALAAVAACADTMTSPAFNPPTERARHNEADPATEWPIAIHTASVSLSLVTPRLVALDTRMTYDAYHASITAEATVASPSGAGYSMNFGPREQHQFWGFRNQEHKGFWNIELATNCGSVLSANAGFRVWWQGLSGTDGGWKLDEEVKSATSGTRQAECPTTEEDKPAAGGGGGPNDCVYCVDEPQEVTWCRVRYTYDLYTGEIYSWTILFCA